MEISEKMFEMNGKKCACGKVHKIPFVKYESGSGVINTLCPHIRALGGTKPFIVADVNTFKAAGEKVEKILKDGGFDFSKHIFTENRTEPDEKAIGSLVLHFDRSCDIIVAVGSGVMNDLSKILSKTTGLPFIIVATAPSMDGFASDTSSVIRDGLKVSVNSRSADVIIGDTDILRNAPVKMLLSGLGDMLAKYPSICEWRIGQLLNGEYYCEDVALLVRGALKKCVDNADGLLSRDEEAVKAVFEGLIISGVAMAYAGLSRPASGTEHYISHIWDMRNAEFGTPFDFHGIQCGIGTLLTAKLYDELLKITPDREKALKSVNEFDLSAHYVKLRELLGNSAEPMIEGEKREKKYDLAAHAARLEKIIANYDEIKDIILAEIPRYTELYELLKRLGAPMSAEDIGNDSALLPFMFIATRDVRDKYILSRLAWDMGVDGELAANII